MAVDQTVLFTIIPRALAVPGDDMPVSVVVSPRLRGAGVLDAFPDWLAWTRRLKDGGLTLEVRCNSGTQRVDIDPGVLEPDLWEGLFDEETPVFSHEENTYEDHGILSFSVRETLSAIKQSWQTAGVTLALPDDPDDPAAKERSPNRRRLDALTAGYAVHWNGQLARRWRAVSRARSRQGDIAGVAPDALDGEGLVAGPMDAGRVAAAAQQFSVFHHMPTPDRDAHPLPANPGDDLDFHQVISALGSYPDLMRRLGLVFDVTLPRAFVPETPLNAPGTLSVQDTDFGWQVPTETPPMPTAYVHVAAGATWLFAPAPQSVANRAVPSEVLGLLDLDPRHFGIEQVDVDGAMHKAIMLADSLHEPAGNIDPGAGPAPAPHPEVFDPGATLPALRSGGFALYQDRRGAALFDHLSRARAMNDTARGQGQPAPPFTAEDLTRGYRLDVWDASTGQWHSLHRRKGEYTLDGAGFQTEDEEGFVQFAAAQPAPGAEPDDKDLYVHECFARWAGWSLSAPRPGKALSRFADPDKAVPDDNDPAYATDEPTPAFPMKVRYQVVPGTLPTLRFGRRYRFRARAVDLAGNSLALDDPLADALARVWALPRDPEGFAFLRYEPVPAPLIAVRDKRAVQEPGSALDRIVIRTWNDGPEKDTRDARMDAADRHLLPPRTAVETGERHGLFDKDGTPDPDPAVWHLIGERDKGELPRVKVEIAGRTADYPVVPDEILDPLPYLPDPLARGVAIRDLPGAPGPSIGRAGGGAEAAVDYHPLEDANPRPGSVTLIPFGDEAKWQDRKGIRLRLREPKDGAPDARPVWNAGKRLLTVLLPKGTMRVVPVSSYLTPDDLTLMGVWQWIREYAERLAVLSPAPDPLRPGRDVDRIAHVLQRVVEGGHWMLTPPVLLTLVHAVQQPLGRPAFTPLRVNHKDPDYGVPVEAAPMTGRDDPVELAGLTAARSLGAMDALLLGALTVHAESTQKVSLKAEWVDPVDDVSQPAPVTERHAGPVDEVPLDGAREGYLLADPATGRETGYYDPEHRQIAFVRAGDFTGPESAPSYQFSTAAPRHQLGDAKRHRVTYTAVAVSRYQEYFPPTKDGKNLDFTRTSDPVVVDVPASSRPLAPDVAYVLPTFGWQRQTDTNVHRSVRFGGGLRVYLRRPWFSSGEGELLGVALWNSAYGMLDEAQRVRFKPYITQWGMDPIWDTAPLGQWPSAWDFAGDNPWEPSVSLEEGVTGPDGKPARVSVVGFPTEYDGRRRLWYADLTLNIPGDVYMPFVRLALTRYQPHALADARISRVVLADFAQLTPTRVALVTTDPHHARAVRVVVSGVAPRGPAPSAAQPRPTRVRVRLEERDPDIHTDLGWNPAPAGAATVSAAHDAPSPTDADITLWAGTVTFPAVPEAGQYRLVIEEHEFISTGDAPDGGAGRLIYAEVVPLNADLLRE